MLCVRCSDATCYHCISKVFVATYLNAAQFLNISFCKELCVLFIDVFDFLFSRFGIKYYYLLELSTDNGIFVYLILK